MKALGSVLPIVALMVVAHAPAPARGTPVDDPVGVWPLSPTPTVVRDFDPPTEKWGPGHRGVDLAGAVGQPVRSALAGAVVFVGHVAGKPVVTISHGDTRTTYEPVSSDLEVGDVVAAGQRVGSLELGFSHCFPSACLHWGWLRGDLYLDPLSLVGSTRVRLLPLWRDVPADHGSPQARPGAGRQRGREPAPPPVVAWWPPTTRTPLLPYAAWSPLMLGLPPLSLPPPGWGAREIRPVDVPVGRPGAAGRW